MTDIPMSARVDCEGNACGRATHVIVNLETRRVTRLVVKERGLHSKQRLVPVDQIAGTTPERVLLRCSRDELAGMRAFIGTQFIREERLRWECYACSYMACVCRNAREWVPAKHACVRAAELAVRRGTKVQIVDGRAGRIQELVMDPVTGCITHLVLREGHLRPQRTVTIPIAEIDRIGGKASGWLQEEIRVGPSPVDPRRRH